MESYRLAEDLEKISIMRFICQSSIKLKYKNYSLGISNENILWGPSRFNSIMMSNNARGLSILLLTNLL